jgi:hypothetical protein
MKKKFLVAAALLVLGGRGSAQNVTGTLNITARVTPTAAKPEPVRDFTFYVLTKSYDNIVKEIDERDGPPAREKFIDGLKISPELRAWLHKHDVIDLTVTRRGQALHARRCVGGTRVFACLPAFQQRGRNQWHSCSKIQRSR